MPYTPIHTIKCLTPKRICSIPCTMQYTLTLALILAVAPVLGMLALDAYVMGVMIRHVYDGKMMRVYEKICTYKTISHHHA